MTIKRIIAWLKIKLYGRIEDRIEAIRDSETRIDEIVTYEDRRIARLVQDEMNGLAAAADRLANRVEVLKNAKVAGHADKIESFARSLSVA